MTSHDDDMLAAWLLMRFGADGERAGLLDEDLLVGYIEDRLSAEERDAVEALLAQDAEARAMLDLRGESEDPLQQVPAPATARPAPRRWAFAAAAVLLLGLGVWMFGSGDREEPRSEDPATRLLALADRLGASDPATFATLRARIASGAPVDVPAVERGGIAVSMPRGVLVQASPTLRWQAARGATSYALQIAPEDGPPVYEATTRETSHAVAEALAPGRYVCEVEASLPFGTATGTAAFRVADRDERAAFLAAKAAIEETAAPEDLQLVLAYFALDQAFYAEALAALAAQRATHPDDPRLAALEALVAPLGG